MTILHLSAVKSWGGGGNQIENLCHELSISNPEVKNIIVVAKNGMFHDRLLKKKFNFDTVPLAFKADPRAIYKIIKLCQKEKVDIVHIHGSTSLTLAVIADKFSDLPPFIFSKKISFPIKQRKQTLYKYNYNKIKKIFCVSKHTNQLIYPDIIDKDKLITIYHGTRIDNKNDVTPFQLREKFKVPTNYFVVGNIANHDKGKNLETFIDVANYLINKKKFRNFHFVQIGSFSKRTEALKEKVKILHLEKNITFLGYLPDASNFLPQFDLSLITSTHEGLPQVIYESFYHKVPVVTTNVCGIPEAVEHQQTGLLANPHDYEKLGNHIITITTDNEMRNSVTANAKQKLHERFTTEIMAKKMFQEYKKIVDGRS